MGCIFAGENENSNGRWRKEGDEGDGGVLSSGACDWGALNCIHNTVMN